jgi:hypothetical protein
VLPPVVLWVDPGDDTGLAWLIGGTEFRWAELGFMEAARAIEQTCQQYGPMAWVGCESYVIDAKRPQTDAHNAIGLIKITELYATRWLCRQLPAAAPNQRKVATYRMLRAIGWWPVAKDDAQSAAQHLLAWLLREHEVPPRERAVLDQLTERAR